MARHLRQRKKFSFLQKFRVKVCHKVWEFCSRIIFSLRKKKKSLLQDLCCILHSEHLESTVSTVRSESQRINFRATAFQRSQGTCETLCLHQTSEVAVCRVAVPAQLVGSGAEEQEKPLSPRARKFISALSHDFFPKACFSASHPDSFIY